MTTTLTIYPDGTFSTARTFTDDYPTGTDSDEFVVTVTVKDLDGDADTAQAVVLVRNEAPFLFGLTASEGFMGLAPVNLVAGFGDLGVLDAFRAVVQWGDETSSEATIANGTITGSHLYATGGIYDVTVRLTDDDGGSAVATTQVTVAGVGLHENVLHVIGTDGRDHVHIHRHGDRLVVHTLLGNGLELSDDDDDDDDVADAFGENRDYPLYRRMQFNVGEVTSIRLEGRGNNDVLHTSSRIDTPTYIDGGAGNDLIHSGCGDDTIVDLFGNNRIHSGDGNDTVTLGDGNQRVWAGAGNDLIRTGSGDDTIDAGSGDDVVHAGAGHDDIDGGAGNDILDGGAGNDTIAGGNGKEILIGGDGKDTLKGDAGDDILIGGYLAGLSDAQITSILNNWINASSYAMGVAAVTGTSGTRLITDGDNQNIFSDPFTDKLSGSGGHDLFLVEKSLDEAGAIKDSFTDVLNGETVLDSDRL